MSIQVLFLIANLVESLLAAKHGTRKRFFICMHSQVIKEVVPFAEIFSTRYMIAGEDTGEAAGCWISELD